MREYPATPRKLGVQGPWNKGLREVRLSGPNALVQ